MSELIGVVKVILLKQFDFLIQSNYIFYFIGGIILYLLLNLIINDNIK